jgi:pyridoxamine 5'-phosphate oxidase
MELADIRKDYRLARLDETDIDASPFVQFEKWFDHAISARVNEPNAMTLATVSTEGKPAARIVLIKPTMKAEKPTTLRQMILRHWYFFGRS